MKANDPGALAAFAIALEKFPDDPLIKFHHQRLQRGESGSTIHFTEK